MTRVHRCVICSRKYDTINPTSQLCGFCVEEADRRRAAARERIQPPDKKNASNNSERDEVAKEIFKLLSVDLVKAAHFNEEISKNFQSIAEANCRAAFLHADLFMEQKNKCQNKSQSN